MVSKSFKKVFFGILLLLVFTWHSFAQVLLDKVIASVNGEPILMSDLLLGMTFYNTKDEKEVLQKLVDTWVLAQYVEGKGGIVDEEYLNNLLFEIAKANNKSLDKFIEDLYTHSISVQDLRNFLRKVVLSTQALDMLLLKEIRVSDIDIEIEKLKRGSVSIVKDINLLVVDKENAKALSKLLESERDLRKIAQDLGLKIEHLRVKKGELIDILDEQVWKARKGEIVFAEDNKYVYVAQIEDQQEIVENVNVETLKEELLRNKLESTKRDLLEKLKKRSFIRVIE